MERLKLFEIDLIYFLLVIFTGFKVVSPCQLNVESPLPIFTKQFLTKKIVFKPHGASLQLQPGESITAYCNIGIMYRYNQASSNRYDYNFNGNGIRNQNLEVNTVEVICEANNQIGIKGKLSSSSNQFTIYCASPSTYDLYESKKALTNCENYANYAIGVPLQTAGIENDIKAGICYDLDRFELKFVNFVAYLNSDVAVFDNNKQTSELSIDLDKKISSLTNYFAFMSDSTFNESRDSFRIGNKLFNAFEFDLASLFQDEPLNTELKNFAYIFNIMWWRQLRQQNWRYFLDALRARTQASKYLVYMGTYGNATIPSAQGNCSSFQSEVVSVRKDKEAVSAPAYIWMYLKSLTHADEQEIVVIAHNSPYVMEPEHSEFCSVDLCDEVEWLQNSAFGNLRRLPTLGYTFCCRPEEVAKVIDYFPLPIDEIEISSLTKNNSSAEKV
ncbi:uncharacterized protein LOC129244945 isoform X1 [Anastrepha obliqua]|uniref:uncharacterized protein LOC129244945 isoform X1 n=1 Tax=Anastrepha obliqua TaxID=95512 RepID=UPI002409ED46|nr:uncharacterized protein LOC129244945 isoform X1 [Anastrepha obliqua]